MNLMKKVIQYRKARAKQRVKNRIAMNLALAELLLSGLNLDSYKVGAFIAQDVFFRYLKEESGFLAPEKAILRYAKTWARMPTRQSP